MLPTTLRDSLIHPPIDPSHTGALVGRVARARPGGSCDAARTRPRRLVHRRLGPGRPAVRPRPARSATQRETTMKTDPITDPPAIVQPAEDLSERLIRSLMADAQ